ncbi:hypothetical protein Tco_1572349, partial [Tanacetum coccineum]
KLKCPIGVTPAEDDELGPDGKKIQQGVSSAVITELTDRDAALSQISLSKVRNEFTCHSYTIFPVPPTLAPLDAIERTYASVLYSLNNFELPVR